MDVQSHISTAEENMGVLYFAGPLLPSDEYTTSVTNFPGMNCFPPYGTSGNFYINFTLYQEGKKLAEIRSNKTDEKGCITVNFDDVVKFSKKPVSGMIVTSYHHAKNVPPELYIACTHKRTGTYMAYAPANIMGDTIYQDLRATSLENTLFWPGMVRESHSEECIVIMNPYKVSYSYQISLYQENRRREQTDVMKIRPLSMKILTVDELFPNYLAETGSGQCALCIAGQYRVVAHIMIKNRDDGIITTIDHLHPYMRG